jgi:hypothetical protein
MVGGDILKHDAFFELNWIHVLNVQEMRLIDAEKEHERNKNAK